jgi:hypothetical protein
MDPEKLGRAFLQLPAAAPERGRLLGGFLVGVAGAVTAGALIRRLGRRRAREAREEEALDRAVEGTFPASDPPSLGVDAGGRGGEEAR